MGNSVKRAISLSKEQDEIVRDLSRTMKTSYSHVLQEAVAVYSKRLKELKMEEEYAAYYADPKNVEADEQLTKELMSISWDVWDIWDE